MNTDFLFPEPFKMPLLFPSQDTLHDVFHPSVPFGRRQAAPSLPTPKRTPLQARTELFPTWSVVDDAKKKANALSAEATKEFEKASAKAQAKTGHIELYSPTYYAACTFGGLLACVSTSTDLGISLNAITLRTTSSQLIL
jgi:solute carrier family 25 phosphate transporter 3